MTNEKRRSSSSMEFREIENFLNYSFPFFSHNKNFKLNDLNKKSFITCGLQMHPAAFLCSVFV